jgi:hypothetical protein
MKCNTYTRELEYMPEALDSKSIIMILSLLLFVPAYISIFTFSSKKPGTIVF